MPGKMQVNPTLVLGVSGLPAFLAGWIFGWVFLVVAAKKAVSKDEPVRGWRRWRFGVCCSGFGNLPSGEEPSVVCLSLFHLFRATSEDKTRGGPMSFLEKLLTGLNVVLGRSTFSLCAKIRPFSLTFYRKQLVKVQPRDQFCEEPKCSYLILWEWRKMSEEGGLHLIEQKVYMYPRHWVFGANSDGRKPLLFVGAPGCFSYRTY